jgi:hypothetical protein
MNRRIAAVVLALILNPVLLYAQDAVFTVTAPSADVFRGPSNVTPVIGHVSRGTALVVSRDLGSWIKIAWPDAEDGIGYVRVAVGRIGSSENAARASNVSPQSASASATTTSASATTTAIPTPTRTTAGAQVPARGQSKVRPIPHVFGVGAQLAPMSGFGASARRWSHNHLALQLGFMRDTMTSDIATGRVTSMELEPGVAWAPFDRVSDYIWFRPYLGSGVSFVHQTLSVTRPFATQPVSDTGIGFRAFGGGELTFASMPQFGLSADVGYRHMPAPFSGFEATPLSVSIAGHWYIK